jgi:hypothetical protein
MLDTNTIQNSSPELREFLELSCLYLAAADQQFTGAEQEWIDASFGHGTADRFMASFATIQWDNVFARINELAGQIPAHEMQLISGGIEDFLKQLLSMDGWDSEEQERLSGYINYLTDIGVQIHSSTPTETSPSLPDPSQGKAIKEDLIDNDNLLKPIVEKISGMLRELPPPLLASDSLLRINEYPRIRTYYEKYNSIHGPYDFIEATSYDFEGKNPQFRFECGDRWYTLDEIRAIWDNCYASIEQIEKLQKDGVDCSEHITWKQAIWALDTLHEEKKIVKHSSLNKPSYKEQIKELGIKHKSDIPKEEAEKLIEEYEEKQYQLELLDKCNKILSFYDHKPFSLGKKNYEETEDFLFLLEEAIDWATKHKYVRPENNYEYEDDNYTYKYTLTRDLTIDEIEELSRGCIKKIKAIIKEGDCYDDDEKGPILKKVAKEALEKTRIDD